MSLLLAFKVLSAMRSPEYLAALAAYGDALAEFERAQIIAHPVVIEEASLKADQARKRLMAAEQAKQ